MRAIVLSSFVMGLLLSACGASRPQAEPSVADGAGATAPGEGIVWRVWSEEAFAEARAEDKMILVDVGIEGCTACRWMFEDTYRDPRVVARVRRHFIAISVDAHVEPDLGDRYARWGWPATIVMRPDGVEVLKIRGNKRPRTFLPILDELIARHADGTLEGAADIEAPVDDAPPIALAELASEGCAIDARLDRIADRAHGGFGRGVRLVEGAPVERAFYRAQVYDDAAARAHALRTAEGWVQLVDPVWGGVFVAGRRADFGEPIPEKRTVHQAAALEAFATAFALTHEARFREAAEAVHRYLSTFMQAEDGTWFATQEDRAPDLPTTTSAAEYYAWDDAARRRFGIPPIDHGVFTDLNGLVIAAYAHLYEVTGDARYRDEATRAARALLATRQRASGAMAQVVEDAALAGDDRMRALAVAGDGGATERVYLKAQPRFGLALVALHRATGDEAYRDAAVRVAEALLATLEDRARGGFFASDAPRTSDASAARGGERPFYDNVAAARFLLAVGVDARARSDVFRSAAERTLRAMATPEALDGRGPAVAELAQAIDELVLGPIELSVVTTTPETAAARALFEAGVAIVAPRKALHVEAPGRYPELESPAVFVCSADACSSPITEPSEVAPTVASFGPSRYRCE